MKNINSFSLDLQNYPKINIDTYQCENRLKLVLFQIDNPLYSAYVIVPVRVISKSQKVTDF